LPVGSALGVIAYYNRCIAQRIRNKYAWSHLYNTRSRDPAVAGNLTASMLIHGPGRTSNSTLYAGGIKCFQTSKSLNGENHPVSFPHAERIANAANLVTLLGDGETVNVLNLGCAVMHEAFYFASLGCGVTVIDLPSVINAAR
jgi:hypothetical protein